MYEAEMRIKIWAIINDIKELSFFQWVKISFRQCYYIIGPKYI